MKEYLTKLLLLTFCCTKGSVQTFSQSGSQKALQTASFTIHPEKHGIAAIMRTGDVHPTNYIRKGKVFGDVTVRYTHNRKLDSIRASISSKTIVSRDGLATSSWTPPVQTNHALELSQSFSLAGDSLVWGITLHNMSETAIRIEDLALPLNYNIGGGENAKEIFEERVVKHHFISGDNSFIFWQRPTGLGPYLLLVPLAGSSFEYYTTSSPVPEERDVFQVFVHSALAGNKEIRGTWRQKHTSFSIPPRAAKTYRFKFRWAKDYRHIRQILVEEGLIDIQVMPGMTIPVDLESMIALRSNEKIKSVVPEFSSATVISHVAERPKGTHIYRIRFARLGENRLTVLYGANKKTYLEFFVTEPLETLYKKRAAFITSRQQHKDPSKWYNGLFGVYDMKNAELRGPDNPDYFDTSRLSYVLTCDDPALAKAPFIAAKNVFYPDQQEIDAVEYYIKNFVWGGLQRTDKELPYPYGVYGTPNWQVNRDTARRKLNVNDRNRDKMHVWRSYDYPHIIMMYYHMYQIASLYPQMTHYLDKRGYLQRARETAKAYFRYPYEILPWYETYKWGCYNELLLLNLIEDLKQEGLQDDAQFLTAEWEKKVKYFIYDDPYPFRSEYAIDATAFESSHALAKYAAQNVMKPDSNLWYDKNLHRWYSHPAIRKEDAVAFMHRQIQANMALRGVIEPAYYSLGSDFRGKSDRYNLSYMSQMGGWSIMDYGLHFSNDPADFIRLGYQSYLSSFALVNSGTAETNYGFWYPGKENDGASGWAFEPQKYSIPWIQKAQGRGPWFYDGEIDLGFGGATRTAASIITRDPVFGMVAYGGALKHQDNNLQVIPKDGLRTRLYYRDGNSKLDVEFDRDGFAREKNVILRFPEFLEFQIENRTSDAHTVNISIAGWTGNYAVAVNGKILKQVQFDGQKTVVPISISKRDLTSVSFRR